MNQGTFDRCIHTLAGTTSRAVLPSVFCGTEICPEHLLDDNEDDLDLPDVPDLHMDDIQLPGTTQSAGLSCMVYELVDDLNTLDIHDTTPIPRTPAEMVGMMADLTREESSEEESEEEEEDIWVRQCP